MNDNLHITVNPEQINLPELSDLLESVKMRPRNLDAMRRALDASSVIVVATADERIVGFARMIDDGEYYGAIWDVAVTPALQGGGIGHVVIERLIAEAAARGLYMVGLFTEVKQNLRFYESLGFQLHENIHAMTRILHSHPSYE